MYNEERSQKRPMLLDFSFQFILPPFVGSLSLTDFLLLLSNKEVLEQENKMDEQDNTDQLDPPMRTRRRISSFKDSVGHMPVIQNRKIAEYDPTIPLRDPVAELYIQEIINNGGVKKIAYEKAYFPGVENPKYSASSPYNIFNSKPFQKRYNYVLKQALQVMGVDNRSLLFKTATLLDYAVETKNIKGFTTLVETVLRLEGVNSGTNNKEIIQKISKEDTKKIQDLLDGLTS